jgi:hypothetical protein
MRASDFMKAIPDATRRHLPASRRNFGWQARPWLVQIHYGQPRLHYEVWLLRRRDVLELGLHFEHRNRSVNSRLLQHFDTYAIAIKAELGESVEVEPWDKGWAKVYETLPLEPFEEAYLERVAGRLAQMIAYLQPILDSAKL